MALEEGFLPHQRSRENPEQLEEERRLLFVGITRAQQELQLSGAQRRVIQGSARLVISSSFLLELPRDEMDVYGPPTRSQPARDVGYEVDRQAYWGDETGVQDESLQEHERVWQEEHVDESSQPAPASHPEAARVTTAAEMLANEAGQSERAGSKVRLSPEVFQRGMVVRHPERGLGKIIAISGEGEKRSATVQFFESPRRRTYFLVHSKLEPVSSGAD